jgi:hypothetical protein
MQIIPSHKNEMCGTCGLYVGKKVPIWFWRRGLLKRGHMDDLLTDRRLILKCIFKTLEGDMDWLDLAEYMDSW